MSRIDLHTASTQEADALWPVVGVAHLFADRDTFRSWHGEAPWRVRIDSRDRAVVLERWRPHLDILAIKGLWAAGRDIPGMVAGVQAVAESYGFAQVLSPLVTQEGAERYQQAGFTMHASVVALRTNAPAALEVSSAPPEGVRIRGATAVDLDALVSVDSASFEPFWAYGAAHLARCLTVDRVAVAESSEGVIGYTLCTVERGSGTLGRLAVVPESRGHGIGAALVAESLRYMALAGATTISLCTQEENATSRSLYAQFGLRELPGRLELLIGDV